MGYHTPCLWPVFRLFCSFKPTLSLLFILVNGRSMEQGGTTCSQQSKRRDPKRLQKNLLFNMGLSHHPGLGLPWSTVIAFSTTLC
jgi:hypothetical protein